MAEGMVIECGRSRGSGGTHEQFDDLYGRYHRRVHRYLLGILRNQADADDVAQIAFMRALRALPRFEPRGEGTELAWLLQIARRAAFTHRASEQRRAAVVNRLVVESSPESHVTALTPDVGRWIGDPDVLSLFENLSHVQRQVLTLRYLFGMTSVETARVLDRTPTGVSTIEHRAITALRRVVADDTRSRVA